MADAAAARARRLRDRRAGETHTVREFCEAAFGRAGLDWERHVVVDPAFYRPADVEVLLGDAAKARRELGWMPKVGFRELVGMMVDADLECLRRTQGHGTEC